MSDSKNHLNVFGPYQGPDKRVVLRREPDGTFAEVDFRSLTKGDTFWLFEPTGEPVDDGRTFIAATDATPSALANIELPWGISIETDEKEETAS